MFIPTLTECHKQMRQHWDHQRYPHIIYVETTNYCNARCTFCLYERMERSVEYMSYDVFKHIANKCLARGVKIGAMFCFGEPLADKGIFEKIRYGKSIGVMTPYLGLNTNASLLTADKFDDILETCSNLTLSFVTTGEDFERLTKLNWDKCYCNAIGFIKYRDANKPAFQIEIGCNDVTGHDRAKVEKAFNGLNVKWARDAEIQWGGKIITGVIDRSIMYPKWVCDGYKGAMQIKPNGDCCFCAYDVVRNETKFANILTDDWDIIEAAFKARWREPSSLCLRCDFWHNYKQMVAGGYKRGDHIDSSWQDAYGDKMLLFWGEQHDEQNKRYLTGSSFRSVDSFLDIHSLVATGDSVLNIGVGNGRCTIELSRVVRRVDVLDISFVAIECVAPVIEVGHIDPRDLPLDEYDLAVCHLVVQHMTDVDLYPLLRHSIRSLKTDGVLAIQFAAPPADEVYDESLNCQKAGLVRRTPKHFARMVNEMGGIVIKKVEPRAHDAGKATDNNVWHGYHIQRGIA